MKLTLCSFRVALDELECPVGVNQHLVYTHVHIGVILPIIPVPMVMSSSGSRT